MYLRQSCHISQSGSACTTSYASAASPSSRFPNLRACVRFPARKPAPAHRQHCADYLARRVQAYSDVASVQTATATSQQTETLPVGSDDANAGDANVQAKLDQLQQTVDEQQRLMKLQQDMILQLQETLMGQGPPSSLTPFEAQRLAALDRRGQGQYDARFHSISCGATPQDFRVLPQRIILVRHAESEGNVDNKAYTYIPDPQVPLTGRGKQQASDAGYKIRRTLERENGSDFQLYFYTSPYMRSFQTFEGIRASFASQQVVGFQEEVQLREQDFGNFQDADAKEREKEDRLRFGRFFYRFPNGESGADVYDRITIFEDHLVRDINAGRFSSKTNLVLITHGLALRIFLMRWLHWTVDQFLEVYNPPNAEPLILERITDDRDAGPGSSVAFMHTKALYRLSEESMQVLKGCTTEMCSTTSVPAEVLATMRTGF